MGIMTIPARGAPYTADDLDHLLAGRRHELVDGCLIVTGEPPLTPDDLKAMPDDGRRYELINGSLLVTPAPSVLHQRVSMTLSRLMDLPCPAELEVFAAPIDVTLPDLVVLQPDLIVTRRFNPPPRKLDGVPLLAIEILSPNTRLIDRGLKSELLRAAGCPSYWIVDPDEPRLTAWDLVDGAYVCVGDVAGDESWTATLPYAVTITPAELVR